MAADRTVASRRRWVAWLGAAVGVSAMIVAVGAGAASAATSTKTATPTASATVAGTAKPMSVRWQ